MTRVLSAVVLGTIVIYLIAKAPMFLGAFAVFAAILIAAHEMAALSGSTGYGVPRVPAVAACCFMAGGAVGGGVIGLAAGLSAGFTLIFMWTVLAGKVKDSLARLSAGMLLLLYPAWALSHLILYLYTDPGRRALLFLLLCVWVCDSAAYYVGSAIGRKKLAPAISPNKTVEGAIGGTLGAAGAAILLTMFNLVPWSTGFSLAAGLAIAVLGQMGDLAESMLKRDAGVKDSGSLIPGHGGMLDRVDALLFTVPVFYYLLAIFGGVL